jgi:demethylmenaquinone methyltransferase/2-methoxy-6-polyprenyl-1,4-benzoquinol methylase
MLATALTYHEVISYFDAQASNWDASNKPVPEKLETILNYANIHRGDNVLDVACGTGVLFPFYLKREVKQVVGVDISSKMIEKAREKFPSEKIKLYSLDIEAAEFDPRFNRVMVFNALPHFNSPKHLIAALSRFTAPGGRVTIAHDLGRDHLNTIHCRKAKTVSLGLISETELVALLSPFFTVDCIVSNEELYVVSGLKK